MSQYITFEYKDGSKYCGESEGGVLHGCGVLVEPDNQGVFEGLWAKGSQMSGMFTWPNGRRYEGDWKGHFRNGLGLESRPDGTKYTGEFSQNTMGPLGVLSLPTHGLYMGTWGDTGVQEGDGVEAYADGGFYRGQYKHGQRSGFGTRSSSGHEQRKDDPKSKSKHTKVSHRPSVASITSHYATLRKGGESSLASSGGSADNIHSGVDWDQIYEGEWANDKRCGHGILKVSNYFTYYGQWKENTRTGYGVLVYEGNTDRKGKKKQEIKEEGRWDNGKLVEPVKYSKLQVVVKTELQDKVDKAHTAAINAATSAREKARVAESKANAAAAKSKVAETKASEARKYATTASKQVEKASKISKDALSDIYRIKGGVKIVVNDHEPFEMKRRSKTLTHDTSLFSYSQLASENDHTHYKKSPIHPTYSCQNFKDMHSSTPKQL